MTFSKVQDDDESSKPKVYELIMSCCWLKCCCNTAQGGNVICVVISFPGWRGQTNKLMDKSCDKIIQMYTGDTSTHRGSICLAKLSIVMHFIKKKMRVIYYSALCLPDFVINTASAEQGFSRGGELGGPPIWQKFCQSPHLTLVPIFGPRLAPPPSSG